MGPSSGRSRDRIGAIVVVKDPSTLQVTRDGGSSANDIIVEKAYVEGGVLVVYCSYRDALMGVRRTLTSYPCFFYRLAHAGTERLHGKYEEVIGDGGELRLYNLSTSGNGRNLDSFQWRGSCDKCQKKLVRGAGIFCEKIYVGRGQYPPCQIVLCRGCYAEHPKDDFSKSGKESGGYWEGELEGRYEKGRTGYYLSTHFQCDLCHFRNMKGRYQAEGSEKDEKLVIAKRRTSLDILRIREPGTLRGNLTMLSNMGKMSREELGLEYWLPPLGTYPLKDEVSIVVVCVTLRMYLRKGRYVGHLQWESMRKVPISWSNLY